MRRRIGADRVHNENFHQLTSKYLLKRIATIFLFWFCCLACLLSVSKYSNRVIFPFSKAISFLSYKQRTKNMYNFSISCPNVVWNSYCNSVAFNGIVRTQEADLVDWRVNTIRQRKDWCETYYLREKTIAKLVNLMFFIFSYRKHSVHVM